MYTGQNVIIKSAEQLGKAKHSVSLNVYDMYMPSEVHVYAKYTAHTHDMCQFKLG